MNVIILILFKLFSNVANQEINLTLKNNSFSNISSETDLLEASLMLENSFQNIKIVNDIYILKRIDFDIRFNLT